MEREEIGLLRAQSVGFREIARRIRRSPSTASRELTLNAATLGGKLEFQASVAQRKAELVARRPKAAKLTTNPRLHHYVQDRLEGKIHVPVAVRLPALDRYCLGVATNLIELNENGAMADHPNRLPTGCMSTSRMKNLYLYLAKASTRPSTFRLAVLSIGNWCIACAPCGRCAYLEARYRRTHRHMSARM